MGNMVSMGAHALTPWETAQPRVTASPHETPWAWFGTAREDPTWEALFDEIEQSREATRDAE